MTYFSGWHPIRIKISAVVLLSSWIIVFFLSTLTYAQPLYRQAEINNKIKLWESLKSNPHKTANQSQYDVHFYLIDQDLNPGTLSDTCLTEIHLKVIEGPLNFIDLNFDTTFYKVDSVWVNGAPATFSQDSTILQVNLDRAYLVEEQVIIRVWYHGLTLWYWTNYNNKPFLATFSEPYNARLWWPCKDTPRDKADSVDIIITVPEGMIVASNGLLVDETTHNGKTTFHWQERYPISTYLVSYAAYEYTHYRDWYVSVQGDSMPIDHYVFPDHYLNSQENFALTKDMITIFADLYGEYPFINEKYGHAEWLWGGAMEHQTCTSIVSFDGFFDLGLISHELAHQWWGDMITCADFHHIWLNEGFATYSEALVQEVAWGEQFYHDHMRGEEYYGDGTIFVEDTSDAARIFHGGLSYAKGSYVLHMLRHVVGDSTFFDIIKSYATDLRYQYKSARTEDFKEVCETISGMNLSKFFQQWIYGEYYPHYAYQWFLYEVSDGYKINLQIDQIQDNTGLFWMPLDIKITTAGGEETVVIWDSLQTQTFELLLDEVPLSLEIDPQSWVLKVVEEKEYSPVAEINGTYLQAGMDTLFISATIDIPDTVLASVKAILENLDGTVIDSIDLYDDGTHHDSSAADGVFSGLWPVDPVEKYYRININKYFSESGYYETLLNAARFTSVGPVRFDSYYGERTGFGDYQYEFSLLMQNQGVNGTAEDVTVTIELLQEDTCFTAIMNAESAFDDIGPGQTLESLDKYLVNLDFDCRDKEVPLHFGLAIASDNYVYWRDTLSVDVPSSIERSEEGVPISFELRQNYPNPFNPVTTIEFALPQSEFVTLQIYDLLGQQMLPIVQENLQAGFYKYDLDASQLASGIYFYSIEAGVYRDVKKMVVLK